MGILERKQNEKCNFKHDPRRLRDDLIMTGGIKPVMIRLIPQPDWVVVEYTTTQGNFRKCLLKNRDAKDHWAKCNDDIKSSYLIRDAEPDDFEGEYHMFSKGINKETK